MKPITKYSTIRVSSRKAHIFDHSEDRVLCGVNRWKWTPFTINKTKYNAKDMLERHKGFSERRGGPNPYKFTCKRCEKLLIQIHEDAND